MKNLHIQNSYCIWNTNTMKRRITKASYENYKEIFATRLLNRSYTSMYIEWWLHNIGYYATRPFIGNDKIKTINERFKHVDLESWKEK